MRLGVSVAAATVALLDELVASGEAANRSAAIDLLATAWRQWQADADLAAAARAVDPDEEINLPGVVDGRSSPPRWPSLSR